MTRSRRALLLVGVALVTVVSAGALSGDGGARVAGGPIEFDRKLPPWQPEMPSPNGWDLYLEAAALLQKERGGPQPDAKAALPSGPVAPLTDVRAEPRFDSSGFATAVLSGDEATVRQWRPLMEARVTECQASLDLLRRARSMECMVPPPEPTIEFAPAATSARMRELARIETGRAALLHLEGKDEEALEAIQDGLAMGAGIERGGAVIGNLVGIAVSATTGKAGDQLLRAPNSLSKGGIVRYAETLRELRERVWPLSRTMHAEGDYMMRCLSALQVSAAERVRLAQVLTWMDTYYVGLLPLLDRPLWEVDARAYWARACEEGSAIRWDADTTADAFALDVAGLVEKRRWHDGDLSAEELSARAVAYRMDHGEYPERLEDLIPDYAESIPPDPWTGLAPLYRREGPNDFVIYSPGPDRKDDGGGDRPYSTAGPDRVFIATRPASAVGAPGAESAPRG